MTDLPIRDIDQEIDERQRRMMAALRSLPAPIRTDVPLTPVPVPLLRYARVWDSVTPKRRCDTCGAHKPYADFPGEPDDAERFYEPEPRTCVACRERAARQAEHRRIRAIVREGRG